MNRRQVYVELSQLIGAIIAIIGAWIISRGLALMVMGAIITAIGTLAERSMIDGSGRSDSSTE